MIPQGLLSPTGPYIASYGQPPPDPAKPISLEFDRRRYVLPAAFRSGNCIVGVHAERHWRQPPDPPLDSDLLYYKLFPLAREAGNEIVQRCLLGSNNGGNGSPGGTYMDNSVNRGQPLFFSVTVSLASARGLPDLLRPKTHVYDASKPEDWNPKLGRHKVL